MSLKWLKCILIILPEQKALKEEIRNMKMKKSKIFLKQKIKKRRLKKKNPKKNETIMTCISDI